MILSEPGTLTRCIFTDITNSLDKFQDKTKANFVTFFWGSQNCSKSLRSVENLLKCCLSVCTTQWNKNQSWYTSCKMLLYNTVLYCDVMVLSTRRIVQHCQIMLPCLLGVLICILTQYYSEHCYLDILFTWHKSQGIDTFEVQSTLLHFP